ncbi:hypothetical protein MAE02_53930 [Microvirga aerophila]|uniref:Uncharacterized protein n=1 Tax=Microvirga aerophila TaxID=670291 RepID=A0A512C0X4_9HYPH|nr:hypothetical protein MAE02_53930 [Microvirga aerophila]
MLYRRKNINHVLRRPGKLYPRPNKTAIEPFPWRQKSDRVESHTLFIGSLTQALKEISAQQALAIALEKPLRGSFDLAGIDGRDHPVSSYDGSHLLKSSSALLDLALLAREQSKRWFDHQEVNAK